MLTLAQLRAHCTDAIGATPSVIISSSTLTLNHHVNAAGQTFMAAARWQWALKSVELASTTDVAYIDLPADFDAVEGLVRAAPDYVARLTTPADLYEKRAADLAPAFQYFAVVFMREQANASSAPPGYRLEVWPTPAADEDPFLTLVYYRGWTTLANDSDIANIPPWIEPLFIEFVRAYSRGWTNDTLERELEAITSGRRFMEAVAKDGETQGSFGCIQGGAADFGSGELDEIVLGGNDYLPGPT